MDSQLTTTSTATSTATEQAWHILALLLSLNRPVALPAELASLCTLFPCPPNLVKFLCLIPNSPLRLTRDSLVTTSVVGLVAVGRFLVSSDLISVVVPRGFRGWLGLGDCVAGGKRKRVDLREEFENVVKRRADFGFRNVNEAEGVGSSFSREIRSAQVCYPIYGGTSRSMGRQSNYELSVRGIMQMPGPPCLTEYNCGSSSSLAKVNELMQVEVDKNVRIQRLSDSQLLTYEPFQEQFLVDRVSDDRVACAGAEQDETCLKTSSSSSCNRDLNQFSMKVNGKHDKSICDKTNAGITENGKATEDRQENKIEMVDSASPKRERRELIDAVTLGSTRTMEAEEDDSVTPLSHIPPSTPVKGQAIRQATDVSAVVHEQLTKPVTKITSIHEDPMGSKVKDICKTLQPSKSVNSPKVKQILKKGSKSTIMAQKANQNNEMATKKGGDNSDSLSPKDCQDPKALPDFESFVVEDEEGSGGYGTVYRARRKSDGLTVAIKCPHANAHRHHVNNEMKMLERFGGKNYIIKFEGSFKNGDSDCFVLEHVEHDRPEVLKKEIDIRQLRWYSYCMFRALNSLHRQGVVHRDVKPGNFLFSRKANKGYLIDFNLALDLHQKYGITDKLKVVHDSSFNQDKLPNVMTDVPTKSRKLPSSIALDSINGAATKGSKSSLVSKSQKRKVVDEEMAHNDLGGRKIFKSQGADGSGVTSARDVTSNRTPPVEKRKEPLPCHGRKELINLLQEAMRNQRNETSKVPVPTRKRVAAAPEKVDNKLVYLTPMPLPVAGAGLQKNKGDGKRKREGPCVGTKGFRAPEVLFRSQHQGPKVDIWSAGVTLLYLITGKSPFFGDPEQNIKEIAKLKGSEDLWEVAKINNCESHFPLDLYRMQYLSSMSLREWCKINTKRPEFLDVIPSTLFDLLEKCLVTNPRLRISAEEALKHDFFCLFSRGPKKAEATQAGTQLGLRNYHRTVENVKNPLKISPGQT